MAHASTDVIIVGGGIAGLACARRLCEDGIGFTLLEAAGRVGGRIKTDEKDGFLLDRGFQVLQSAYPEARRMLDYRRLDLRPFAPGAVIRVGGRFHTVADPLRRPKHIVDTMRAPIGSLADRLRLVRLTRQVAGAGFKRIFAQPETTAMAFLQAQGFSKAMVARFFIPFFGGVCLDPEIRASSRVLQYVLKMFAAGDAALPAGGMEQIPRQLADELPAESIRTGVRVERIKDGRVVLTDGGTLSCRAAVLAVEAPEMRRLLGLAPEGGSMSETCYYFAAPFSRRHRPFLFLNGEGAGPVNNVAFPASVSPGYAPPGQSLASVVVLGRPTPEDRALKTAVKAQLSEWFGREADNWRHLATYRIGHALPDQCPPTSDPTRPKPMIRPGIYACGEFGGLPGIQWALFSGRRAAEAVIDRLAVGRDGNSGPSKPGRQP